MSRSLLITAVLLLSVAACSDDPAGGGTPPATIRIDGNNVGPSDGLVFISQGGQSVSDASVTVTANGVAATPTNGGYYWQFGTPLTAGATLTVRAVRNGATATVVGTLPATPVLVEPALNASVTPGTPLTVTWTSASNPAYFLVHLGYRVGTTGLSVSDSVAGDVRTIDLATAAIPAGATNLSIDIRAVGADTPGGDATANSKLRLYATTENRSLTNGPVPIRIVGGDTGPQFQTFTISRGGADVSSAVVTVNGTQVTSLGNGNYTHTLPAELPVGQELVITVAHEGDMISARATVPSAPILTAPIANQVVTVGQPLDFTWAATADPSSWETWLQYVFNGGTSGSAVVGTVAGSARSGAVATTTLPGDATNLTANVLGYLVGTFTGPADPTSDLRFRITSNTVALVKGP